MMLYIVFVLCLSIDTFMAAISYQTSNIKIPFKSNLIISFTCSISLLISLLLGNFINNIIDLKWLSFFILLSIGFTKIFNKNIKNILKNENLNLANKIKLITIYSDYKKADFDNSKNLSIFEAFYLSLALSLDNIVSGISFNPNFYLTIFLFIFSFLINTIVIYISKIFKNINYNLSFLGGLFFIILAFSKLKQ